MNYVLLIPGWFPSRVNFLAGDFIERHAMAASQHVTVKVLFVVKDNSLAPGKIELEHRKLSHHYESFVYYYSSKSSVPILEKAISVWLQSRCLYKGFRKITATHGMPSLIHAHVLLKHAWFALRLSKKYQIPLLASEQWTGYLPEAIGEFGQLSYFQRKTIAAVLRHAVHVTTVSDYLAKKMRERFVFKEYTVIPNLVNQHLFRLREGHGDSITRFIHISTLSAQKNIDEMLDACAILQSGGDAFQLLVVGPEDPGFRRKLAERQLQDRVECCGEMQQVQLSKLLAACDALILYSNYETFGCVIVEANACGVPVIVSDHPVFFENVEEGVTGFRVPLRQPAALAACMRKIINNAHSFDKDHIRSITEERYSFEVVGKQFAEVYLRWAKP